MIKRIKKLTLNENNDNINRTMDGFENGGMLTAVDKQVYDEVLEADDRVEEIKKDALKDSKSFIPENPDTGKKVTLKPYTECKNMLSRRKYLSEDYNSLYQELLGFLKYKGFDTSNNDVKQYASAATEYISLCRDNGDWYSIEDWYKDTEQNYPEDLADLKKLYESYRRQNKTKKINEGWNDIESYRDAFFDILREAGEDELRQVAQDLIYWCSEDEIKRFMEIRDYDLFYDEEDD